MSRGARRPPAAAPDLRLTIDLVPRSAWWRSLYRMLPRSKWEKLRQRTLAEQGKRCVVCGAEGEGVVIVCDELWHYDDESHVAQLVALRPICRPCSFVKHIGHAGILASQGKLDLDALVAHFLEVNGCGRGAFEQHREAAFTLWEERSRHDWRVDFGEYAALLPEGARERGDG